ncbi:MAG: GIY-YIG nuclease family protein [Actinomycetota bacterium]|nr:GIY-YIG nuclease family protein [Actinomycetota bacterium]
MIAAYMLRCGDGSYYVGSARNIDHRMMQHYVGRGSAYTSARMPVELIWFEEFDRIDEASAREKQVQGWSRSKREALVDGRILDLPSLAKKRFD